MCAGLSAVQICEQRVFLMSYLDTSYVLFRCRQLSTVCED